MASGRTAAVRVARRFGAPPARILDAWLDPRIARQWLFATASRPAARVDIEARVGGRLRIVERLWDGAAIEHRGEILQLARPRCVAFSLSIPGGPALVSRVGVDIAALDAGSALLLTHDGVPRAHRTAVRTRWIGLLYGLATLLGDATAARAEAAVRGSLLRKVA